MIEKLLSTPQCRLDKWVQTLSAVCTFLSLIYYFSMGVFVGFGVSLLFVWLLIALVFAIIALKFPSLRIWWRGRKKALQTMLTICITLPILMALLGFGLIFSGFFTDIPSDESVDCIIILGAQVKDNPARPSLALSMRIDAAYEYLVAHPDTVAIASGGQGADEPMSEAACIFSRLVDMGIEPERIILEDQSTSTAENLQYSAALIPEDCTTVGIVTNNFHAFRGEATARKYLSDIDIYRLPADFHPFMLPHYIVREFAALTVDMLRGNLEF